MISLGFLRLPWPFLFFPFAKKIKSLIKISIQLTNIFISHWKEEFLSVGAHLSQWTRLNSPLDEWPVFPIFLQGFHEAIVLSLFPLPSFEFSIFFHLFLFKYYYIRGNAILFNLLIGSNLMNTFPFFWKLPSKWQNHTFSPFAELTNAYFELIMHFSLKLSCFFELSDGFFIYHYPRIVSKRKIKVQLRSVRATVPCKLP